MQFHFEGPKAVAAITFIGIVIGFSIYGMVHYLQHLIGVVQ